MVAKFEWIERNNKCHYDLINDCFVPLKFLLTEIVERSCSLIVTTWAKQKRTRVHCSYKYEENLSLTDKFSSLHSLIRRICITNHNTP